MRTQKQQPTHLQIYCDVHDKLFPLLEDRSLLYERKWSLRHHAANGDGSDQLTPVYLKDLRLPACRNLIRSMSDRPPIYGGSSIPGYRIIFDYIQMPTIKSFTTQEDYYATLFHELIHSTGHPDRLARFDRANKYFELPLFCAMEEMTAEIGAAYLTRLAGIFDQTIANKAAYIAGYLRRFESKKVALHFAIFQAQRAVEFLLPQLH